MSAPNTFFVSEAALRNLKSAALRRVSGVRSSHLSEGIAAALGFTSQASLRSALRTQPTVEAQKPSNARLNQRLRELGYSAVPDDLRLLPEFEHSYGIAKTYPLRKARGVRWLAWRNLLVTAINAGLDQGMFGLAPTDNWWPGGAAESHECQVGRYRFLVDGDLPAVASVDAISGDELSIHVVLRPRDVDVEPNMFNGLQDGEAFAHCWVERRLGAWMQDGGEDFSCRRAAQSRLASITVEPKGYSDQGSFFA